MIASLLLLFMVFALEERPVHGWYNGHLGSTYGTHDWIADRALDWLPETEKRWILDRNGDLWLASLYLYGTEMPDITSGCGDCIGDASTQAKSQALACTDSHVH